MQPDDKLVLLIHNLLNAAIEETEDNLRARRVKPTGSQRQIIGEPLSYYIETEPLRLVVKTLTKMLPEGSVE